jgi:hypothetical protein
MREIDTHLTKGKVIEFLEFLHRTDGFLKKNNIPKKN